MNQDIQLKLVEPAFAKHYWRIVSVHKDALSEWLAWPLHGDDESFYWGFIEQALQEYRQGQSLICAIEYQQQIVGTVSFNHISQHLHKVEMGYWLSPDYQGRGIITQSVAKMVDYAFIEMGMAKVQISAAEHNLPSRNVCERLGFTLEGIIRHAENINGRIVDHAVYGMMKSEWAKRPFDPCASEFTLHENKKQPIDMPKGC